MKTLTIEEYAESLYENFGYDSIIDEMFRDDSYSAEGLLKFTVESAKRKEIELIDLKHFDYHTYFWHIWRVTEKGLS